MTQISDSTANPEGEPAAEIPPASEPGFLEERRFPTVIKSPFRTADDIPTFLVPAADIVEVSRYLREEAGFLLFEDITAVDWQPREPRFEVIYHFLNLSVRQSIRLKVPLLSTDLRLPSITSVFKGANWYEREVYDLFGITFEGHPNLTRIEMPENWEGHPLRKDYPITGFRRPNLPANHFRPEGRELEKN